MRAKLDTVATEIFKYLWRQVAAGKNPTRRDYSPLLYRYFPNQDEKSKKLRKAVENRVKQAMDFLDDNTNELSQENLFYLDPDLCDCEGSKCQDVCVVDAIVTEGGKLKIDPSRCIDCGQCYKACESGAISDRSHLLQLALHLRDRSNYAVYAIIAPSFVNQFEDYTTYESLKAYLLAVGFDDVWEVALAADILTVQEADDFIDHWRNGRKFMITSCCCPAFIKLVEKHQPDVSHMISNSISPMIAMGRILKAQDPNCKIVFLGPCLAKRGEIRKEEFRKDVDVVLTYKEFDEVIRSIHPDIEMVEDRNIVLREASHDGRIYAFSGGVTQAIMAAVQKELPDENIVTVLGNGIKECSQLLESISAGSLDAHFVEGMACPGGCVGGPGTIIPVERGEKAVKSFAVGAGVEHSRANSVAISFLEHVVEAVDLISKKEIDYLT